MALTSPQLMVRALGLMLALVVLLAAVGADAAQALQVDPDAKNILLDNAVSLFEDPHGRLDFAQIREKPEDEWQLAHRGIDLRNTRSTWWARIRLAAPPGAQQARVWEIESAVLPFVQMYTVDEHGNLWQSKVTGSSAPFGNRPIDYRSPAFPLELRAGEWVDVYLKIFGKDAMFEYVPIHLWDRDAFYSHANNEASLFGLYYGAALGLLLYNLFLFVSTRQRAYGYYVIALATFVLFIATYRGHGLEFLWPDAPDWNSRILGLTATAVYITEGLFALEFMETRKTTPRLHRGVIFIMLLASLPIAGFLLDRFSASFAMLGVAALSGTCLLVAATVLRWRQGSRAARYYVIASLILTVGGSLAMAGVLGIVPNSVVYPHAVQLGSVCEFLLLAFGLADAMNVLRAQKLRAERAARQLEAERNEQLMVAKDAAESISRIKDEILANVSHEMRTPLHAILGFAKLGMTRYGPESTDKTRAYFEKIHAGGTRLVHFVENLLELARLNANEVRPHPTRFDPEAVVQRVVQGLQPLLLERRLSVRIDKDPSIATIEADSTHLERILLNLTANAMKFSPPGGEIAIVLSRVPILGRHARAQDASVPLSYLRITIADQGPGIPPNEIDAIFDPFVQSSRTNQKSGGTGLGLTICRRLVQLHGGTLRARNLPGSGAAFDVDLPESAAGFAAA